MTARLLHAKRPPPESEKRQLPDKWKARDVAAFISAVDSARELLRDLELSRPRPTVRGLLVSVASAAEAERKSATDFGRKIEKAQRGAMAEVHRQPLWRVLNRDLNFKDLQERLASEFAERSFDRDLTVLRAVALGVMISSVPPKRADARTRSRAENLANKLIELRKLGVRLGDYGDDSILWRLLDDLIREMKSKELKSRWDKWSGTRAALSYFASELFELIGPDNVSAPMLEAFGAMLVQRETKREIQRRLQSEKSNYRQRVGKSRQ